MRKQKRTLMYKIPDKDSNSHKGEKGKVLVVGGSDKYYGAPILTALAAEKSGADLITICLPKQHILAAQHYSLNFFLHSYVNNDMGLKDIGLIIELSNLHHAVVIGNGIGDNIDTQKAVSMILQEINIPVVIDAEALLPEILNIARKSRRLVTPHKKEFKRLFGTDLDKNSILYTIVDNAKKHDLTIVVKGAIDYIATGNKIEENHTGCPQMRVGGTGDALAGIITSYIAQGLDLHDAAKSACYYFGKAGEILAEKQTDFSCYDLIKTYPAVVNLIRKLPQETI
jgi:hydroxyethylthiazole kinase-like uncharacterized protein yjeF